MSDGSIRVETKLDTKGVEKGLEDIDIKKESTDEDIISAISF